MNETPELASQLAARIGRGVTLRVRCTYRNFTTGSERVEIETRKGVVRDVAQQEENGAWFVDLKGAPMPGLSNNVTVRIYLSTILSID